MFIEGKEVGIDFSDASKEEKQMNLFSIEREKVDEIKKQKFIKFH